MKSGSSISALEIEQERTVGFIYWLSGPLHSKILLHANKRYTKGVPFMSKMVYQREVVGPRSGVSPYETPGDQEKRVI